MIVPMEANLQNCDQDIPSLGLSQGQLVQLLQDCEKENKELMLSQQHQGVK